MRKMYRYSICLLFYLAICFVSFSQVIDQTNKTNASFDYARLARIDTLVNTYIKNNWIKGVVTIIMKDNQLIQFKGYGFADEASGKKMQPDAIFRIASQTKAIVSVGIMVLYEQGKLQLDDPVSKFIPEFKNQTVLSKFNEADTTYTTVPAKRDITIHDLLTHSSGIDYAGIGTHEMNAIYAKAGIPSGLGYFDNDLLTEMKKLAKLPLGFQPGTMWRYGLNVDLLGCLIELISGKNLEEFLRANIFDPIGMRDTYFNVPATKVNRLATVYTEDSLNHIIPWSHTYRHLDPDYPKMNKHYFSGGAGLSSTAYDYAIFMQMLLNGGSYNGHKVLSPRSVEMMTSSQLDFRYNGTDDFGLGFDIVTEKGSHLGPRNIGSFSWGGYFGTTYWADPKEKLVCLIMTQQTPNSHGDLMGKVTNMIYSSLVK